MCNAVSFIVSKEVRFYFPAPNTWDHSHTSIAKHHGLPDGLIGDSLARCELTPKAEPDGLIRWHSEGATLRTDVDAWKFTLDERRVPGWWNEDAAAWEDRARREVAKWLKIAPGHLAPGATLTGGEGSTLTGGYDSTLTGGDDSTLTGGNYSTLTVGNRSTLTGGNRSTLTGGYGSTLTGGEGSTLTGGDDSTLTGGYRSTLTGGEGSTLTGGDDSTLTGGDDSTLTGGDDSTLTGGYGSTLTGGEGSTLTGGDDSTLIVRRWDSNANRYRVFVAYVGEDGIEPNVRYRLDEAGKFARVQPEQSAGGGNAEGGSPRV